MEEISQDEKEKIREEKRRKILKELRKEKHVSYSSHNSCKSLNEELRDYYKGSNKRPQEVNINLLYFQYKQLDEIMLIIF